MAIHHYRAYCLANKYVDLNPRTGNSRLCARGHRAFTLKNEEDWNLMEICRMTAKAMAVRFHEEPRTYRPHSDRVRFGKVFNHTTWLSHESTPHQDFFFFELVPF